MERLILALFCAIPDLLSWILSMSLYTIKQILHYFGDISSIFIRFTTLLNSQMTNVVLLQPDVCQGTSVTNYMLRNIVKW